MLQANAVRLSFGALALSAVLLSCPARAELDVISSTVPGLKVGTRLPNDATLDVEKGQVLRVMRSGTTYEIAGPYHGTIDDYTKRCSGLEIIGSTCDKQSGDDLGATTGATRGVTPQ